MKLFSFSTVTDDLNHKLVCRKFFQQPKLQIHKPVRTVPGFSIQSYQKHVVTDSPPKVMVRKSRIGKTLFRMYYNRGDIPVCLEFRNQNKIAWKVHRNNLFITAFFNKLWIEFAFTALYIRNLRWNSYLPSPLFSLLQNRMSNCEIMPSNDSLQCYNCKWLLTTWKQIFCFFLKITLPGKSEFSFSIL